MKDETGATGKCLAVLLVVFGAMFLYEMIRISIAAPIAVAPSTPVPTATPHDCPPLVVPTPMVCPTVTYRAMPDGEGAEVDLGLQATNLELARKYAYHVLTSTPGEYNPELASAINYLDEAITLNEKVWKQVQFWNGLGYLTCP